MTRTHSPFSSTSSYGSGTTSSPEAESAPRIGLSQAWETNQITKWVYRSQEELRCQVQAVQHCKSIQQCLSDQLFWERSHKSGKNHEFRMQRQMLLWKMQVFASSLLSFLLIEVTGFLCPLGNMNLLHSHCWHSMFVHELRATSTTCTWKTGLWCLKQTHRNRHPASACLWKCYSLYHISSSPPSEWGS